MMTLLSVENAEHVSKNKRSNRQHNRQSKKLPLHPVKHAMQDNATSSLQRGKTDLRQR